LVTITCRNWERPPPGKQKHRALGTPYKICIAETSKFVSIVAKKTFPLLIVATVALLSDCAPAQNTPGRQNDLDCLLMKNPDAGLDQDGAAAFMYD